MPAIGSSRVVPSSGASIVPANGYGITGNTGSTPTPAVSLTTASGVLGSDFTLSGGFQTFLSSASLGVGTWIINVTVNVSITSGAGAAVQMATHVIAGTATATFSGVVTQGVSDGVLSNTSFQTMTLTCKAVVTVAGTIAFQGALAGAGSSGTVKASDPVSSTAGATGYTAWRIA